MTNFSTTGQPYLQSNQNRPLFYGEEKTLKVKRGADLLATEEDNDDFNDREAMSPHNVYSQQQPQSATASNVFYTATGQSTNFREGSGNGSLIQLDQLAGQKIVIGSSTEKSRQMKNQFNAFNEPKMKRPNENPIQRIQQQPAQISVINYNNPTINMNFNDNQFTSPKGPTLYEDHDFYDQLNYSKMTATQNKKSRGQSPGGSQLGHYNAGYNQTIGSQSPWGKQQPMSALGQKLSNLTSATMNTHANAIIKTVMNPYADDISKAVKSINQPISQQVSRAQSRTDVNSEQEDNDDIEEISHEISKKKPTKKKIIKKIIKKRNPDGTLGTAQVQTYVVERDGTINNQAPLQGNSSFMTSNLQIKNPNQTVDNFYSNAQVNAYDQMEVKSPKNEDGSQSVKKKVKKIIIKKKKKPTTEVDESEQSAAQLQAFQIQQEKLVAQRQLEAQQREQKEREENLRKQLEQEQEEKAKLEEKLKQQEQKQQEKKVIKIKRSQIKKVVQGDGLNAAQTMVQEARQESAQKPIKRLKDDESASEEDIDLEETRKPGSKLGKQGQKSRNQYKTTVQKKKRRENTEEVGQSASESEDDERAAKRRHKKKRRQADEDSDDEEEVKGSRRHREKQQQMRSKSNVEKVQKERGAKKQPIKKRHRQEQSSDTETEEDDEGSDHSEDGDGSEDSSDVQNQSDSSDEQENSSADSHTQRIKNFKKQQMKLELQQEELNQKKKDLQRAQIQIQQQNPNKTQGPLIQKPMSFKVAVCDVECYKTYIDQLVFGTRAKDLIMNPIPFQMGQIRFTIERHRSGFNRLHPSYYFYLEKNQGGRVLMLYAKKRAFNKTANYLISMEKNKSTRSNNVCLGKLRANPEGDKYILYDNGENFTKIAAHQKDKIRTEHGIFSYRYEPCNVGNIRKMIVIIPSLTQINLPQGAPIDNCLPLGQDQEGTIVVMTQKEQDTMMETFTREGFRNQNYSIYVDNPPAWNPKTNTYVYDFKGRVTQPSIKNFQLIPEQDGRRQVTLQDFVLQFGKNGKNTFILDVQYPFSIFQAFGLALSAFDTD